MVMKQKTGNRDDLQKSFFEKMNKVENHLARLRSKEGRDTKTQLSKRDTVKWDSDFTYCKGYYE